MSVFQSSILVSLLTLACASSSLTGCAAEAASDDVESSEAALGTIVAPGEFKLYDSPRANPTPTCDVHGVLVLSNDEDGAHASLAESVDGTCEIFVERRLRELSLTLAETSCGSKIFKGTTVVDDRIHTITITDHRSRLCRDLVPARIIVAEKDEDGAVRKRYSFDAE